MICPVENPMILETKTLKYKNLSPWIYTIDVVIITKPESIIKMPNIVNANEKKGLNRKYKMLPNCRTASFSFPRRIIRPSKQAL